MCAIADWNGFNIFILFFQKYYDTEVIVNADGPERTRRYVLESDNVAFELIHDDFYGNYFFAVSLESEKLAREIGENFDERLKNI